MPQIDDDVERAAKVWGDTAIQREQCSVMGWMDSPIVLEYYVHPKISGDPKIHWLIGVVKNLSIPPGSSWLSLGCGSGIQEVFASRMNLFRTMVAYDASHDAIRLAREHAAKEGVANIHFAVEDIGKVRLPQETYDAVTRPWRYTT